MSPVRLLLHLRIGISIGGWKAAGGRCAEKIYLKPMFQAARSSTRRTARSGATFAAACFRSIAQSRFHPESGPTPIARRRLLRVDKSPLPRIGTLTWLKI